MLIRRQFSPIAAIWGRDKLTEKMVAHALSVGDHRLAHQQAAVVGNARQHATPIVGAGARRTKPCTSKRRICRVTRLGNDISPSAKSPIRAGAR